MNVVYTSPEKDIYLPQVVIRKRPKKYRENSALITALSPPSSPLSKPAEIIPIKFSLGGDDNNHIKETPSPSPVSMSPATPVIPPFPPYVPPVKEKKTNGKKKSVKWNDNDENMITVDNCNDLKSNIRIDNDQNIVDSNDESSIINSPKKSTPTRKSTNKNSSRNSPIPEQSSYCTSKVSKSKLPSSIIKEMDMYSKHMAIMCMIILLIVITIFSVSDYGLGKLYRGSYMSVEPTTDNIINHSLFKLSITQPDSTIPTLSSNLSFELSGAIFNDNNISLTDDKDRVLTVLVRLDGKLIQFPGGNSVSITNLLGPLTISTDLKEHGLIPGSHKIMINAIISNNDNGKKKALKENVEYSLQNYIPIDILAEAKESILIYYIDELMTPEYHYSDPNLAPIHRQVRENDFMIVLPTNNSIMHIDEIRVYLGLLYIQSPSLQTTLLFDKKEYDVTEIVRKQLPITGTYSNSGGSFSIELTGIEKGDHVLELILNATINDKNISSYDFVKITK